MLLYLLVASQPLPGLYFESENGAGWAKIFTGKEWINETPLRGQVVSPKVADTAVLWVDRNHGYAVAEHVAITGDGMHIFAGWWLNNERVSAYRTLGTNVPIWVDSLPDAEWQIRVDASQVNRFTSAAPGHPTMDCYDKGSATPLWEFAYPAGFSASGWKTSAVSYDGAVAAFIGSNGVVGKVWIISTATGDTLWTREFGVGGGVYGVDLSDNGSVCLVTRYDSCIVWENGNLRGKFYHYGQVPSAISGDGSIVASANYNGTVQVWRWNGSTYVLAWQDNVANSWATSVDVSRDGSTIACGTGYSNGTLRVYDASSPAPLWTYAGYGGYGSGVWGVAVSGNGSHIIAVSWGDTMTNDTFKVITVHDRSSPTPLLTVDGRSEPGSLFSCDISDDGVYATAGGKAVHAYQFGNGGEVYAIIIGASASVNVGTEAILSPPRFVQLSSTYQVQARFRNYGDAAASFPVYFRIDTVGGTVYSSSASITNLAPGSPQTITFSPNWTPPRYNLYKAYAWTALSGDQYHGDDTLSLVIKCFHDAMAVRIDQPFDTITVNQPFTPGVTVKNNGSYTEAFEVIFNVYDSNSVLIYSDTALSSPIAPEAQTRVTFSPQWAPPQVGSYTAEAITRVTDNYYTNNDTIRKPFQVTYEIIYDDGSAEAYYVVDFNYDNNKFAVRFTPTVGPPLYITRGRIYVNQANKPFDYVILCPDASGRPDTAAPYDTVFNVSASSAPGWAFFDFSPDIYLTSGSDVWLVIHWPPSSPGAPGVGADNNWFIDTRSWWYKNSNGWTQWTYHDWMIRITQATVPTEVAEGTGKPRFWVGSPSPNPLKAWATLSYSLPDETDVQVNLYTADGRLAGEIFSGKQGPGLHKLILAPDVPAGVYFLRLVAGNQKAVRKIAVLR